MKVLLICLLVGLASAYPIADEAEEERVNDPECGKVKIPKYRIVGGSTTERGEFPWQISLRFCRPAGSDICSHTCGGSIIDPYWILCASHCFLNSKKPENYKVLVGAYNQTAGTNDPLAKMHEVAALFPHAEFGMAVRIKNDVSLIKLKTPIDMSSVYVNRVCLPESRVNTDDKVVDLSGWGDTFNGSGKHIPSLLKKTQLVAKTSAYCEGKWGKFMFNGTQMVCAEAPETSPCVGDSGGPLVIRGEAGQMVQVGIVSFGEGTCAGPRPGVYTRVDAFLDWIKTTMTTNA